MSCFEKVHGGYKVDGLELKAANCGCGGFDRPRRFGSRRLLYDLLQGQT